MKNNTIFILILIFFNNILFSQNSGIIEYKYIYKQNDQDSNKDERKLAFSFDKRMGELAKNHQYVLEFNKQEGIYKVIPGLQPDDVGSKTFRMSQMQISNGVFYMNLPEKYQLNQKMISNDLYIIKIPIINDWTISYEKKYISGYKCYKATKKSKFGKIITAWFTPDIPLGFGPAGFCGTPGLILELHYMNNILVADKIKLKKNKIIIQKPKKGKFVTQEQYKQIIFDRKRKLYEKMMMRKRNR